MVDLAVEGGVKRRQVLATHSAGPHRHPECGSRSGALWYCVQAVLGREAEVCARLEAQGFGAWCPLVQVGTDKNAVMKPAFPSYLFVRFDVAAQQWRCIHSTRGVRRLFGSAPERPTPLRDAAFRALLARGFDKPLTDDVPAVLIQAGVPLRISAKVGPWSGREGLCLWSAADRVGLMLQLFGRPVEVSLRRDQVEIAAAVGA